MLEVKQKKWWLRAWYIDTIYYLQKIPEDAFLCNCSRYFWYPLWHLQALIWTEAVVTNFMLTDSVALQIFLAYFSNFLPQALLWSGACRSPLSLKRSLKDGRDSSACSFRLDLKKATSCCLFSQTCLTVLCPSLFISGITSTWTTCLFQALLLSEVKLIWKFYKTCYIIFLNCLSIKYILNI